MSEYCYLPRDSNQARGIARYAIDFLNTPIDDIDQAVAQQLEWFHVDSVACAIAALACRTNAPTVLRTEALRYAPARGESGAYCFASNQEVDAERAIVANCSAVRELDANGTNFGYNPETGDVCGEFGHNDFYPFVVAAAQQFGLSGTSVLLGMLCLDEIRGRLAEVFSLKTHRIDHVVHGGIASAAVYGALAGGTEEQIESAIGTLIAHYIPFRAIRAGDQLSDSKGASAALTAEMAVRSVNRSLQGFVGPKDIFRNPQAVFRLFQPTAGDSPFDLRFAVRGGDFAIRGMHFKLGLYEHQSAGAIQGIIDILAANPQLLETDADWQSIRIRIYEPAFGIIGDPAKRDPRTRQSADHSMVYIVATLLRKALQSQQADWHSLMLLPTDYEDEALFHPVTRRLMEIIDFEHGGPDFDARYPDGIPTSIDLKHSLGKFSSGLVMYPLGHARHSGQGLNQTLQEKSKRLVSLSQQITPEKLDSLRDLASKSPAEVASLYRLGAIEDVI